MRCRTLSVKPTWGLTSLSSPRVGAQHAAPARSHHFQLRLNCFISNTFLGDTSSLHTRSIVVQQAQLLRSRNSDCADGMNSLCLFAQRLIIENDETIILGCLALMVARKLKKD
jgi:hypothetical protein